MRIQKLVIYGFGQHEDVTIELKNGINVFFGWNEAGKTTIQQFMLSVLFGFPLRNQGLLRYEPKGGGRHGGQVHVDHPEFGRVVIERVKGKSSGDVTVFFEDGRRGGEESLKKVLFRYDRTSFESIFSFSIHQLQNFDKMTEDELSRTLLASGTTGVDALTKLEQRATKEMNSLFKKSGRNPEMNMKIEEIRTLEQTLKETREKIDQFEPSILRISEIDESLQALMNQEKCLKTEQEHLAKYHQAKPLLDQKKRLELNHSAIDQKSFPPEGIRRYESLKDRLQELDIQINRLTHEIEQAEKLSEKTFPIERVKEMEDILSKESEWHHFLIRRQQLTSELEQSKREMDQQARLLGIKNEAHFNQVIEMDVSLQKEEHFQQTMQSLQHTEETIRFETQSHQRVQAEVQEIRRKEQQLQASAPSDAEQQKAGRLQKLIRQVAELKAQQIVTGQRAVKNSSTPMVLSGFILLAAFIGAFLLQNLWVAAGGIILALLIYGFSFKSSNPVQHESKINYAEEIASLENEISQAEHLVEKVRMFNERMSHFTEQLEEKQVVLKSIEQNVRNAEQKRWESRAALNDFLQQHGFDGLLQPQLFPELFKRIRQIQELNQSIMQKSHELHSLVQLIQHRLTQIVQVTDESLSENQAYGQLRNKYSELINHQKDQVDLLDKVEEWKTLLAEKQKLFDVQSFEQRTLWAEANVDTEPAFYAADAAYREKQKLEHELQAIDIQLATIGEIDLSSKVYQEGYSRLEQLELHANQILSTRNELLEEKAVLKQLTSSMLSDEQYGLTLQRFEQKKAELSELAKKWSVQKAVTEAIRQTMSNLKEKRLPFVLERAHQIFRHLTRGRYESLEVNNEGIFEAVNPSGTRFSVAELSQATKEQAYISLRFALAESLLETVPLPILMDDPFVHFDRFRTQQMVQLMTDLENQHQFFYFTCHEEMKVIWPQANVIDVTALRNERSVSTK